MTHNEGVLKAANILYKNKNYNIKAHLSGWTIPPLINGKRPDIVVYNSGGKVLFVLEVETDKGLVNNPGHAQAQARAFLENYKLVIIVV